jgi:ribulose-5-phosphate 4-epimerase/fuculose-1-phosphate aldolase
MIKKEPLVRQEIVSIGKSLFDRGLSAGSSGNISVRLEDGFLMTPTGSTLANLDPETISKLDQKGNYISGDPPTKESSLHLAVYGKRPEDVNPDSVLPAMTPYQVMRIGTLPLIPYYPPGDPGLAQAVGEKAAGHSVLLLANHGPVVTGKSLKDTAFICEELEEAARIYFLTHGLPVRHLTRQQVEELARRFKS